MQIHRGLQGHTPRIYQLMATIDIFTILLSPWRVMFNVQIFDNESFHHGFYVSKTNLVGCKKKKKKRLTSL